MHMLGGRLGSSNDRRAWLHLRRYKRLLQSPQNAVDLDAIRSTKSAITDRVERLFDNLCTDFG